MKKLKYLKQFESYSRYTIDGKEIDMSTIEIGGVDLRDYPDFTDAYIERAQFVDGEELSNDQLDRIEADWGKEYAQEHAFNTQI